jgi:hypothetical protein
VTEFRKDEWTILSGYLEDYGAWGVSFSDDGRVEGSVELPLTYHADGLALGLPIAAQIGETTVDGWVFEAEGTVTYCAAPGATYVYGDGWDAMILDERRYLEWNSDNFSDPDKYHFVANDYENWVVASENAPRISAVAESAPTSEIEALARKIAATSTLQGVTDPKWGAINWSDKIREDTTEGGAIYWLDAELDGHQFSIEIDDGAPLGYANEYDWSAAIVSNSFVTQSDTSILHYGQYAINVSQYSVIVVDTETGESQQAFLKGDSKKMSDDITLLTLTDGKHAKCVTMRPELIAFMYAISG